MCVYNCLGELSVVDTALKVAGYLLEAKIVSAINVLLGAYDSHILHCSLSAILSSLLPSPPPSPLSLPPRFYKISP